MNILDWKAREEFILKELKGLEDAAKNIFAGIAEYKNAIEALKKEVFNINLQRESYFKALGEVHVEMNELMDEGEKQAIADIKAGKAGLVDTATGKPMTVALFARR